MRNCVKGSIGKAEDLGLKGSATAHKALRLLLRQSLKLPILKYFKQQSSQDNDPSYQKKNDSWGCFLSLKQRVHLPIQSLPSLEGPTLVSEILQYWFIKGNDFIQDVAKSKKVHDGETSLRKRMGTQAGNCSPEEGYEPLSVRKSTGGPSLPHLSFCFLIIEMDC